MWQSCKQLLCQPSLYKAGHSLNTGVRMHIPLCLNRINTRIHTRTQPLHLATQRSLSQRALCQRSFPHIAQQTRHHSHSSSSLSTSLFVRRFSSSGGEGENARGRDPQLGFQLAIMASRAAAHSLPYLWRNRVIQSWYRKHPGMVLFFIVIPAVGLVYFLVSHASFVPYTNRLHFTFLGPATEMRLGEQAYHDVVAQEKARILPSSDPTVQQVKSVVSDVLRVAAEDGVVDKSTPWEVNVIESNVANAFVLPNGKIFVYTGILPVCQTQAGLACVLGHEVSHALAHHSVEKMGVMSLLLIVYDFVRGVIDSNNPQAGLTSSIANFLATSIAQVVIPLAHSRKMETEADQLGLILMSKAGYNPQAGVDVWEQMKRQGDKASAGQSRMRIPEFLSTHPSYDRRIENMRKWAEEGERYYRETAERYRQQGKRLPNSNAPLYYRPTKSAGQLEYEDRHRETAQRSFEASALLTGEYKQMLSFK